MKKTELGKNEKANQLARAWRILDLFRECPLCFGKRYDIMLSTDAPIMKCRICDAEWKIYDDGAVLSSMDKYNYGEGLLNEKKSLVYWLERSRPRDSITISPTMAILEAGNWQASSLFKVQNNTKEILYQICVKLTIDHPHIRIQDFTVEAQNSTDEPHVDIGQIGEGSEGKKAKYLIIEKLNPGEIWQFIITKNSPYIDSLHRQSILRATILSFDKEPTPTSIKF